MILQRGARFRSDLRRCERQAAGRPVVAETERQQLPAGTELHGVRGIVDAFEGADGERRACTGQVDDLFEFVAAELHRHRTDDDAEPERRQVDRGVLGDVRQLGDEDVVAAETQLAQPDCVTVGEVGDVAEGQAQRGASDQ